MECVCVRVCVCVCACVYVNTYICCKTHNVIMSLMNVKHS